MIVSAGMSGLRYGATIGDMGPRINREGWHDAVGSTGFACVRRGGGAGGDAVGISRRTAGTGYVGAVPADPRGRMLPRMRAAGPGWKCCGRGAGRGSVARRRGAVVRDMVRPRRPLHAVGCPYA